MRNSLLFISLIIFFLGCKEPKYEGFAISDSGLHYRIDVLGNDTKVRQGNYLTVAYTVESLNKKLLKKSRKLFKLNEREEDGGIVEGVYLMSEEDSMVFYMPAENIYNKFIKEPVPKEILKSQDVKVSLKVEKVQTEKEFINAKNKFRQWLMTNNIDDQNLVIEEEYIGSYIKETGEEYSVTPNGLYYHVVNSGEGNYPEFGKGVLIDYEGVTLEGLKFDSTKDRGQPFDFILGNEYQVIKGIEEGIFLMKPGAVFKFIIPSHLAYGESGTADKVIQPNTPVIYYVELLAVGE